MNADQKQAAVLGRAAHTARTRLLALIEAGALRPGERLGGERALAQEVGVSRQTLRQALEALERDGVVERAPGRTGGVFVAAGAAKVERDLTQVLGLPANLARQGVTPGTRVLSARTDRATAIVAGSLGIADGTPVHELVRLRLADDVPISLEKMILVAERFPGLLELALDGSMYELLDRRYGVSVGEAVERIEVASASAEHADLLGVALAAPLLSVVRVATDRADQAFEYSHDLFRADRMRLLVRSSAARVHDMASPTAHGHAHHQSEE